MTASSSTPAPPRSPSGVRRGIPLGQAHRLAPEAVFLPPDPAADAAAVEAALDALAGFSPGIAGPTDPADRAFGSLEVQVDGLEALWGLEPDLVGKVRAALAPLLPGTPRAGIAGTRFAAALAAATGPGPAAVPAVLVPRGQDGAFIAPFPASALSRDADVRGRLARFGLLTIGAVAVLPRSALVARFGVEEGGRLHDRANGVETDPFRPRRAPERLALGIALDEPVTDLEALRFVLRRLAGALAAQLDGRGQAAGRARLVATLDPTFSPGRLPLPGATSRRSSSPSASPSRPPIPRRSSGSSSSGSSGSCRPCRSPVSSWSSSTSSRRPATSWRSSRRRRTPHRVWAGSSPASPSASGRVGWAGWPSPTPRRRSPRRAGRGTR